MNELEKELGNAIAQEGNTINQVVVASLNNHPSLQKWLNYVDKGQKATFLFELEMWLKSFQVFFITKNHPFLEQEIKDSTKRSFAEELKIARSAILRMSYLANQLIEEKSVVEKTLGNYYENLFQNISSFDQNIDVFLLQPTPEDSLALLTESFADICAIIDSLIKTDSLSRNTVSLQAFVSIGKILLRDIKRSYYINLLMSYKFKAIYDRVENEYLAKIIENIDNELIRQEITKVLIGFFRLLKYLDFIALDLTQDRPLKNCLPIFILIKTEAYQLIHAMEHRILNIADIPQAVSNSIDGCIYALQMDLKKVYGRELLGLIGLTQAPPIYAKIENSHGLLRDCFQQSVVTLLQIFETGFDGLKIFKSFQTKLDQSLRLRLDIWRLLSNFRKFQSSPSENKINDINDQIGIFRESSLKYLMYKDWDDFEKMSYQAMSTRVLEDYSKTIHVFATFLEALLGQINMRAVLANHPFDYPEV
jgi:hypothetical protein